MLSVFLLHIPYNITVIFTSRMAHHDGLTPAEELKEKKVTLLSFRGMTQNLYMSLPLISHQPGLSHMHTYLQRRLGNVIFVLGGKVPS